MRVTHLIPKDKPDKLFQYVACGRKIHILYCSRHRKVVNCKACLAARKTK